jgi:uncharacterized membrane protein YqjE
MNSPVLAMAVGAVAAHLPVARWVAAVLFLILIAALGWGLLRSRKQIRYDEADAALEADFRRLEQEVRR